MLGHIFRTYDIRGLVGTELIIDEVYRLGRAIAAYFIDKHPAIQTVVVGMDGRTHSLLIKDELIRALRDSGLNVMFIGICPTPVLYFALHTASVDAGLMVTASHNGPAYNGIKICLGTESVWGNHLQSIRHLYERSVEKTVGLTGSYQQLSMIDHYVDWLVDHFSHLRGLTLPLVIDCANGATGTVIPQLIERLEFRHTKLLYQQVDGNFPHHEADPTIDEHMNDLRVEMKRYHAELGIGFDGDGDRMAPLTSDGTLVYGDKLLLLLSKHMLQEKPGSTIVFDIKCSSMVTKMIELWGGRAYVAPSGHSIIKHVMREQKAIFAGELSCHFFFADRYFGYDDGIYAALRLIELLSMGQVPLNNLVQELPEMYSTSEIRIACHEDDKKVIVDHAHYCFSLRNDAELLMIDGVRATLPYGWGLIRASNTQSHISVRCESSTKQGLSTIKHDFYQILVPYIEAKLLHSLRGD